MKLISKFNKGFWFLLCIIKIYGKYVWVVPLKDKKDITIISAFQNFLGVSIWKPNKIWLDKGSKFYNRSIKSWFQDNNIEMYSTRNEDTSVFAERVIRILKNKIYKYTTSMSRNEYMTSMSKNVYIHELDDKVSKYNSIYHRTIQMKPVVVKSSTYIDFSKENIMEDPKFEIGDHVRI